MWSASTMTTSGAPLPAVIAVWNLSYSGLPPPTLFQQTWTSSCALLKLSMTSFMFGYQAHIVTTGASDLRILFEQLPWLDDPPPPPLEHAARTPATAMVATAAMTLLIFTDRFPFGCGTALSVQHVLGVRSRGRHDPS